MGEGHVGAQTGKGRRKREKDGGLDLNVPQVAGSAVAAVVAAKLASNLGVYGTITGAGVVSALGTCGGTILQHVFRRTGRQVHEAALQALPRTRQMPVQAAGTSPERWADGERAYLLEGPHLPTPEPSAADRPVASALDGAALDAALDPTQLLPRDASQNETLSAAFDSTRLLPQDASEEQTRLLASAAADANADPGEDVTPVASPAATSAATGSDGTRLLPHPGAAGVPAGAYSSTTLHRVRRPGWKRPAVAVALAFGLTMGGITLYEAASGHTLSGHGRGTTIGNAFTGHTSSGSGHRTTPAPSETDTPSTAPTSGTGAPSTPPTAPPTTPDHRTTPPPSSPTNPVTRTPGTGGGSSGGSTGGTGSGSGGDHTAGPTPSVTPSTSPSAGPGSDFDGTGTLP